MTNTRFTPPLPPPGPRRPLRVLHLIEDLGLGGAGRQLLNILSVLPSSEHAVCHLRPGRSGGGDDHVAPLRAQGIPVRSLGLRGPADLPRVLTDLYTELCRGEFHLLTTQVWLAHSLGRAAAVLCGVPVVSILTSAPYAPQSLAAFGRIQRLKTRAVQAADLVTGRLWLERSVAVSQFVADYALRHLRLPQERIVVIPNSVDLLKFRPPDRSERQHHRAALGLRPTEQALLCVCRPCNPKGVDLLLDALGGMLAQGRDVRLLVLGVPPEHPPLMRRAAAAGSSVARAVTVLGQHLDVWPSLAAADAFVSASPIEGLPVAVLEAMACGLPCLLSDIPAHDEVAAGGLAAVLVPPGGWQQALVRFLDDPAAARTLGERARRRCVDHYASHQVAAQFDAVFQHAAAQSRWQRRGRSERTRLLALLGRGLESAAQAAGLADFEIGL